MDEKELSKKQILIGNIFSGVMVVITGLFLLLVGLGVFQNLTIRTMAFPAIFICIGLTFLFSSFVQKNPISMWFAVLFLMPAIISILVDYTPLGYKNLYPLYISIPAFASFGTMFLNKRFKLNLKVILIFGSISAVFALGSSGLVKMSIVIPIFIVMLGLLILYTAIKLNKDNEKEN